MLQRIASIVFILVLLLFLIVVAANQQLKHDMLNDQKTLIQLTQEVKPSWPSALDSIPDPLHRYLLWAVTDSLRPIRIARIQHGGYYGFIERQAGSTTTKWKYIVADRWVAPGAGGFAWHAMMHLGCDFWTKCRMVMMKDQILKFWKWMGVFKYSYEPESILKRNTLVQHMVHSVWVPTQLITDSHQHFKELNDTTFQIIYTTDKDTVSARFIVDPEGQPKWFVTNAYLLSTDEGINEVKMRVKYWQYLQLQQYRLPSRMSAMVELDKQWIDLFDFRLDLLECQY